MSENMEIHNPVLFCPYLSQILPRDKNSLLYLELRNHINNQKLYISSQHYLDQTKWLGHSTGYYYPTGSIVQAGLINKIKLFQDSHSYGVRIFRESLICIMFVCI